MYTPLGENRTHSKSTQIAFGNFYLMNTFFFLQTWFTWSKFGSF